MRPYSTIKPTWWTGPTGQHMTKLAFEAGDDVAYTTALELRVLGTWLYSGSMHNQYGLFYAPEMFIVPETGIRHARLPGLFKAFQLLQFCTYDRASSWVWVYEMAKHQFKLPLSGLDNQAKAANHWYATLIDNPFLGPFYDRYRADLRLTVPRREGSGSVAPSKGLVPDTDLDLDLVQDPVPRASGRAHRSHAFCGTRLCLPTFLFEEFKGRLGGHWKAGLIESWARQVDESFAATGEAVTEDPIALWRAEFTKALKTTFGQGVNGGQRRGPSWRERCPHGGSCGTRNQCAEKSAREHGTTFGDELEKLQETHTS